MVINRLAELKFKKGEVFTSYHINIKNDNMRISEEFAKYIISLDDNIHYNTNTKYYHTKLYVVDTNRFKTTIGIRYSKRNGKNNHLIYGMCGDYSYNLFERDSLGLYVKRRVNKYLINLFLYSPLSRFEKIERIKNKILKK